MFGLFTTNENQSVGLDLGASHIKVVGLKNLSSAHPKVFGVGVVPTPHGAISDGSVMDPRAVKLAITNAFEEAKISLRNQNVVVGLKGLNVLFKRVVIPFQEGPEMAEQIILEAQQQVDSDLNDWIIDYQILSERDEQGQVAVLIVAGRRPPITEIHSLLIELGTRPVVFDCDVFAVSNVHERTYRDATKNTLLLDVGKDSTKVMLKDANGLPILVRSMSIGGGHLTESLARGASMDIRQAEIIKVSASQSGSLFQDPNISNVAKKHIEEVLTELNQTLDFYAGGGTGEDGPKIESVLLSGGAATTAGLAHSLSQSLRAKVEFADPFRSLDLPSRIRVPEEIQPHVFSTSIGLALRFHGDKAA